MSVSMRRRSAARETVRLEPVEFTGTSRFEIVSRLGAGGMGVVYEALDRERGSRVALKTLRELTCDQVLRLKREFRALSDIRHPNLVALGELFEDEDRWFYTMELVDGCPFSHYVRPRGVLDETRLRHALLGLSKALRALHEEGVIHRDIKPENVLVTKEGRVVLLDFGLTAAKPEAQPGDRDFVFGTAAYMAPEQATLALIDPAADMYALGVMLFEALAGGLPVTGDAEQVMRQKKTFRVFSIPGQEALPKDLMRLCSSLVTPHPPERPTAADVIAALEPASQELERRSVRGSEPPFVGRERELALLGDAYVESLSGKTVSVFVQGEAGLGKSSLLRRFVSQTLTEDAIAVCFGRCFQTESVPYKAFDGLLEDLVAALDDVPADVLRASIPDLPLLIRVFPVLTKLRACQAEGLREPVSDARDQRALLFAGVRQLFALAAASRRLVLLVDDLQWADDASLLLIENVLFSSDSPPLLLVGTYTEACGALSRVIGAGHSIALEPLDSHDAVELAQRLLHEAGAEVADLSAQVMAMEGTGHPLFVRELVRYATGGLSAQPAKLEHVLEARLQGLTSEERRLLELVCVAGAPIRQQALAEAFGADLGEFGKHLSALRRSAFLRTSQADTVGPVEIYHQRLREAVLAALEPEQAISYHECLAKALEKTGDVQHAVLARHWAGSRDSARAAMYAYLAAEQAASALAFERAAELYLSAIQSDPQAAQRKWELHRKLGDALAHSGHGRDAADAYLTAAALAPAQDSWFLRVRALDQFLGAGYVGRALKLLPDVLPKAGLSYPGSERSAWARSLWWPISKRRGPGRSNVSLAEKEELLWSLAHGLLLVDPARAHYYQNFHRAAASATGEPHRTARALALAAVYEAGRGPDHRHEVRALLEHAGELAEEAKRPSASATVVGCAGLSALAQGRFRLAVDLASRAERLFLESRAGSHHELATARATAMTALSQMGDFGEMKRRQRVYLHEARERGDRFFETFCQSGHMNILYLAADDSNAAERALEESQAAWAADAFTLPHYWNLLAGIQLELYRGHGMEARARLRDAWPAFRRSRLHKTPGIQVESAYLCARVALAVGDTASAHRWAKKLTQEEAVPHAQGLAHAVRGCLAAQHGKRLTALQELTTASEQLQVLGYEVVAVAARFQLGSLRADRDGQRLVEESCAWFRARGVKEPEALTAMLLPR